MRFKLKKFEELALEIRLKCFKFLPTGMVLMLSLSFLLSAALAMPKHALAHSACHMLISLMKSKAMVYNNY